MQMAKIKYLRELRTEATHLKSGKIVITDAPTDNQGKGAAFSPSDLLCASLASCALTIIGIAAKAHNITFEEAEVGVTKIMKSDPRRVGEIILDFTMPKNNFTEREKLILENAARTCPVAKSLSPELNQVFNFLY